MNPVAHFILRVQFRSPGATLDATVFGTLFGIKVKGITCYALADASTACFVQTDGRYRASYIRRCLVLGRAKRKARASDGGLYYNTLVADPSAHIVHLLEVDPVGSQRFAEAKHAGVPTSYRDSLLGV
jgi:hypothetical protein